MKILYEEFKRMPLFAKVMCLAAVTVGCVIFVLDVRLAIEAVKNYLGKGK